MNALMRLRERTQRNTENGFTLVEMMFSMLLLSMLILMTSNIMITTANHAQALEEDITGQNQGPVMDRAQEIHEAAVNFQLDRPDAKLTKKALIAEGYVEASTLPADFIWGVGVDPRPASNGGACVAAYSISEQVGKYTKDLPAEVSASGSGQGLFTSGCQHYAASGQWTWVYQQ